MGLTNASEPDEVMRRRQKLADEIGFELIRSCGIKFSLSA